MVKESYADYYPFGMVMPNRFLSSTKEYRFGYQGQFAEKDAETGLDQFELREYDPRIGRWLVPDPYSQHWSPYMAMGNNPINLVDPDGGIDGDPIPGLGDNPGVTMIDEVFCTPKTNTSTISIGSLYDGNKVIQNALTWDRKFIYDRNFNYSANCKKICCSGFAELVLGKVYPQIANDIQGSAQHLFEYANKQGLRTSYPKVGDLMFFGKMVNGKFSAGHVEFVKSVNSNGFFLFGASGSTGANNATPVLKPAWKANGFSGMSDSDLNAYGGSTRFIWTPQINVKN